MSLGFGFRGGLFFASLFLGSLLGRVYAEVLNHLPWMSTMLNPTVASLVGMSALAVAVIGGPFTMTFLVLETTGDFGIAAAALTASLFSSVRGARDLRLLVLHLAPAPARARPSAAPTTWASCAA